MTGDKEDELDFNKVHLYDKNSAGMMGSFESDDNDASLASKGLTTDGSQSSQVFGYDRNIENVESNLQQDNMKRMGLSYQDTRVQVQQEETGSQRVQVSNGYQEPFVPGLNPTTNRVSSGQFLEWSLTFYGTGPADD